MSTHRNKQAGGTLLGLILGLIIGLSVAVVVAVTVKNMPLPFSSKSARTDKAVDAASSPAADPNKSLYGSKDAARQAAKEAAKDAAKPDEQKAAAAAETPKDSAEAAREAARAAARASTAEPAAAKADPKLNGANGGVPVIDKSTNADGKLAKLDPGAAADEKYTYYLQAGAFLQPADAENAKAKLALLGIAASIAERKSDNGTLYRVRIGPFAQLETMNRVRSKLTDNGVDVAVVRVPK